MSDTPPKIRLKACHCCGLVHRLPVVNIPPHDPAHETDDALPGGGYRLRCTRCGTTIAGSANERAISRTMAFALAALLLYPLAVNLPVMKLERLGHTHTASIWGGTIDLLAAGEWFVGLVVLICSVVLPLLKLAGLLTICLGQRFLSEHRRAFTYRIIEWTGRWGMVDVLLVAILVAAVKLGDIVHITPGPGVIAFAIVVALSLIAAASFDPHAIWEDQE